MLSTHRATSGLSASCSCHSSRECSRQKRTKSTTIQCGNKSIKSNENKRRKPPAHKGLDAHILKTNSSPISSSPSPVYVVPKLLQNRDASVALCFTYLGDAVWELFARQHLVLRRCKKSERENPPNRQGGRSGGNSSTSVKTLRPQRAAQDGWCSAVAMHSHLERLLSLEQGTFLTEEEMAILKWGADYGHESRARHSGVEHRDASALEALVAYLYLFDGERLMEVLGALGMTFMDAGGLQVLSGSGRVEAVERALERFEGGGGREEENEEEVKEEEDSEKTMSALQLENETLKKEIEELKQKALIAQRAVRLKR